ncbi:hypothetical protein D3C83_28170 [compost metagenome]
MIQELRRRDLSRKNVTKEDGMKTGPVWMALVLIGLAATFFITLVAVVLDWIKLS